MWQKYLIYGAALGVSIKTLSEIPLDLSQQDQMILVNHWGGSIDGGNLNAVESLNSIGEAIESVSNSISEGYGAAGVGSSGGFSGGGVGGGGGGGGGAG
jgi:uncharacterized membrane protein